jgi:Mg-chelatase subunit ChlD
MKSIGSAGDRPKQEFIFVVDCSNSMSGGRIASQSSFVHCQLVHFVSHPL